MPDRPIVALDICVLLRFSGLNMGQNDALVLGPFHKGAADVFRTVVDPDRLWCATPFDDPVQGPDNPLGGQREVDLDAQAFTVEVVQNVQQAELATVSQTICHEVHGPDFVRLFWHDQLIGLLPFQPFARLDPEV